MSGQPAPAGRGGRPAPARSSTGRRVALALTAVLGVYLVAVGQRGITLVQDGRWQFVLLGIGVLALPLIGLWILWREMRFGSATERLARELEAEGALPVDERVRTAGGRVDRTVADAVFARVQEQVEAAPADWRGWYRLAIAYADAGDQPRARQSMRRAIALHDGG